MMTTDLRLGYMFINDRNAEPPFDQTCQGEKVSSRTYFSRGSRGETAPRSLPSEPLSQRKAFCARGFGCP